jgi:hypothetical protein
VAMRMHMGASHHASCPVATMKRGGSPARCDHLAGVEINPAWVASFANPCH